MFQGETGISMAVFRNSNKSFFFNFLKESYEENSIVYFIFDMSTISE